uniref:Uncharacterized protein n=1 Tax=Arundo donax TaxID=35708 RepID=A0A0A9B0B4_ARUDO
MTAMLQSLKKTLDCHYPTITLPLWTTQQESDTGPKIGVIIQKAKGMKC